MSGTNSMAESDACPMHQRGPCMSVPVIYKVLPHTCTALTLAPALQIVQHQQSNKWLTNTPSYKQHSITFICIRDKSLGSELTVIYDDGDNQCLYSASTMIRFLSVIRSLIFPESGFFLKFFSLSDCPFCILIQVFLV